MSIIRVQKVEKYLVMDRTALNDTRLSWKAKGILAYMLSMPNDWTFYLEELQNHATDGKDSLRSGFNELKKYGYVKRYPVKDPETKRIISWETVVMEIPEEPHTDIPHMEKPQVEKPFMENPPLLSTDINQVLKEPNIDKKEKASHNPFVFYQENGFGVISGHIAEKINLWTDDLSDEIVVFAMQIAVENNKVNWAYTEKILRDWANRKLTTMDKILAARAQFEAQKQGGNRNAKSSNGNAKSTGYKADLGF